MDGNDTGLSIGEWVILLLILTIGLGYALWSAMLGMSQGQEQVTVFTVPGEVTFELDRPGSYLIYNKVQRSADSQDEIRPPGLNQLRLNVQHVASGERLQLEDARGESNYAIRRTLAESLYRFRAGEKGAYFALAEYDDPQFVGDFEFIVAQDFRQQLISGLSRAGVVMVLTFGAVGILAYRAIGRGRRENTP